MATMFRSKIRKLGTSVGMIVPKEIVKREELHEGDIVKVEIIKEKRVDAFGMLKGMPSFNKEDEGDSDF